MSYKVNIYSEFGPNLRSIWRIFENECDNYVFQCYDWIAYWYQTVGINNFHIRPCIIVVTDNSMPVALFPFGLRKCLGARVLEFLGGDQSDYNAPLVHPNYSTFILCNDIWKSVLKHLPRHDFQLFNRMPALLNQGDNPVLKIWSSLPVNESYAASLAQSWGLFQQSISPKIRNDSKRQLRRLSELGTVELLIATTDKEYDRLLPAMIEQKRRRYQETGARDILSVEATKTFYRGLRGAIGDNGSVHLSALILDDKILATHWGMVYGDRFYFLMPTYAGGEWRKFSMGRLLQEKIIEWAIEDGLKIFDFTIGCEEYKKKWCDQKMTIYSREKLISIFGILFFIFTLSSRFLKMNPISRKYLMKLNKKLKRFLK